MAPCSVNMIHYNTAETIATFDTDLSDVLFSTELVSEQQYQQLIVLSRSSELCLEGTTL